MAAVSPTPEEPRPVVDTASGATFMTARNSWLLATPGSPTMRQFMSPRRCVPLARLRSLRNVTSLSAQIKHHVVPPFMIARGFMECKAAACTLLATRIP